MAAPATPSLARARYRHLGDGYFSGAAAWVDLLGRFACAGLFSDANACSTTFRGPRQASPKNSLPLFVALLP
ncbi:MAG: hypothetical protein NTW41_07260 [Verrucomicrobia bacterium]|nr:hypothetical protein [Verrucomicrobiota bacterium]